MAYTKSEWRRMLLAARAAIPEAERRAYGAALVERVRALASYRDARTVLGYVAIGAEVDPAPLCTERADDRRPRFAPGHAHGGWVAWGGRRDADTRESPVCDLELPMVALVPGVGFDGSGVRLGRGAGFYDRALVELRLRGDVSVVGLAFECQVVAQLPSDPWDQRVDVVVTEKRVLEIVPTAVGVARAATS